MSPIKNPSHKIKAFKKDIVPIWFFFDLFSDEKYPIFVLQDNS